MKITFTGSFERDHKKLSADGRVRVWRVLEKLPAVLGRPHLHSGAGIRKLHPSGIFEARIGLGLRLVFAFAKNELILHRVGDHEAIRRYLKSL